MEKKKEEEEEEPWSHPDVTLPHLLSLSQAFLDILCLASGFQSTGSPALWRPQDVKRALGWASLLQQILKKIPASKEGNAFKHTLDLALEEMMHADSIPEGLPKLTSEVLAEAKQVFICTMIQCLGYEGGQIESLIAATSNEETDWTAVLQNIRKRHQDINNTKSLVNTIHLATPMLNSILASYHMPCCQQWRKRALTYLLDEKTLYKLAGANLIFNSSSVKWKTSFQKLMDKGDRSKVNQIVELCCLQLSCDKRNKIITKLMEPCERISCSRDALGLWHSTKNLQVFELEEIDDINAYLSKLLNEEERTWWNIPPILTASTLSKGTHCFSCYAADLYRHMDTERHVERSLDNCVPGDIYERIWCLQLLQSV